MSGPNDSERASDEPAIPDGYRVLIDRLWPRGAPKTDAEIDEWARGPRRARLTLVCHDGGAGRTDPRHDSA